MKKNVTSVIGIIAIGMLVLAGCSSTKPEMGSLETTKHEKQGN